MTQKSDEQFTKTQLSIMAVILAILLMIALNGWLTCSTKLQYLEICHEPSENTSCWQMQRVMNHCPEARDMFIQKTCLLSNVTDYNPKD